LLHVDYRIECGLNNKTSNYLFCHGFDGIAVIYADCKQYLKYLTKGLANRQQELVLLFFLAGFAIWGRNIIYAV